MVKLLTLIICLLVVSIVRARVVLDDGQKANDEMCGPIVEILCMRDAFHTLVEASRDVQKLTEKIEKTTVNIDTTLTVIDSCFSMFSSNMN